MTSEHNRSTRRRFLAGVAALTGAGAAGTVTATMATTDHRDGAAKVAAAPASAGSDRVPFSGEHQAGIVTSTQRHLAFAAFDVTTAERRDIGRVLTQWSTAARLLATGEPLSPSLDSGEAIGLSPACLTVTLGLGPSLFDHRFGLADRRPAGLTPLPAFPGERLEPARCDGDLCIQACADDPQVAFHAVRTLTRIGRSRVALRWLQLGFQPDAPASDGPYHSPRNLMGFKDGTNNIIRDDPDVMAENVWVDDEAEEPWMRGGTYLVARRIRILLDGWDGTSLTRQEAAFGRYRHSGAPLTGVDEHDAVDLNATRQDGKPIIPADAHIRLAAPAQNGGVHLLRRGYSYVDPVDAATGKFEAGLFFISFQKDPHRQFVPIQRRLAEHDALNAFIRHTGSALFACPAGVQQDATWAGLLPA
jgi:deferrochelatase/peroxidase EfeB